MTAEETRVWLPL